MWERLALYRTAAAVSDLSLAGLTIPDFEVGYSQFGIENLREIIADQVDSEAATVNLIAHTVRCSPYASEHVAATVYQFSVSIPC